MAWRARKYSRSPGMRVGWGSWSSPPELGSSRPVLALGNNTFKHAVSFYFYFTSWSDLNDNLLLMCILYNSDIAGPLINIPAIFFTGKINFTSDQ